MPRAPGARHRAQRDRASSANYGSRYFCWPEDSVCVRRSRFVFGSIVVASAFGFAGSGSLSAVSLIAGFCGLPDGLRFVFGAGMRVPPVGGDVVSPGLGVLAPPVAGVPVPLPGLVAGEPLPVFDCACTSPTRATAVTAPIIERKKRIECSKANALRTATTTMPRPVEYRLVGAQRCRALRTGGGNYFLLGSPELEGGVLGEVLSRGVVAPPGGVVGLPEFGEAPVPELLGLVAGGLLPGAPESRHPSVPARVKQATPTRAIERSARIFYSCVVERANRDGRSLDAANLMPPQR